MPCCTPGETFPDLTLTVPGGQTVLLPGAFAGRFGVVLFYRGSWCPYCNAQLHAFQRASGTLASLSVQVAALSVDDEASTADLIAKHHLTYPVGRPSADSKGGEEADSQAACPPGIPGSRPGHLSRRRLTVSPFHR